MLNTVSWQQFFVAVVSITLIYYSYVLLRYFRPEISRLFNLNKNIAPPVSAAPVLPVMGAAQPERGTASLSAEDLVFAPADDEPEYLEKTPSEELLSESLTLANAFEAEEQKPEFLELLSLLISKYKPHWNEIDLKTVQAKLRDKLSFPITDAEWHQLITP